MQQSETDKALFKVVVCLSVCGVVIMLLFTHQVHIKDKKLEQKRCTKG